jgi:hypothetical protein
MKTLPNTTLGLILLGGLTAGCATISSQQTSSAVYSYSVALGCGTGTTPVTPGSTIEVTLMSNQVSSPRAGGEAIGHVLFPGHQVFTLDTTILLSVPTTHWVAVAEMDPNTCQALYGTDVSHQIREFARYLSMSRP